MTQQIYTTPTPFTGTNISIPNSGKGYTSNMVIKGQTYQNLFTNSTGKISMSMDKNTNIFTHNCNEGVDSGVDFKDNEIKPSTVYTIVITFLQLPSSVQQYFLFGYNQFGVTKSIDSPEIGITYKIKATSKDIAPTSFYMSPRPQTVREQIKFRAILLEGDWTNKEVPSEITGIESVGDKESNKISILSHNKNLLNLKDLEVKGYIPSNTIINENEIIVNNYTGTWCSVNLYKKLKPNTKYFLSYIYDRDDNDKDGLDYRSVRVCLNKADPDSKISQFNNSFDNNKRNIYQSGFFTTDSSGDVLFAFYVASNRQANNINVKISEIMLVETDTATEYEPYKEDKKEILLPIEGGLKSLPNGVCDTIEQRDDGIYLVQRVGKYTWTGAESFSLDDASDNSGDYVTYHNRGLLVTRFYICNKFIRKDFRDFYSDDSKNMECTSDGGGYPRFYIRMLKSKLNENTVSGFKQWLQANPVTVYYKFDTPVETKLDIDTLNLQTFKDLTYVTSDNSIEPVLEFKAPILGYKTINPIQLKTTQDGTEVNVYPYSTPELITFGDNETLADKMNNIGNTHAHNNATVTTDGFMSKESYAKLESLTEYTHPSTHAATMITEDSTHRFITDTERNNWNAKASTNIATPSTNGLMSNTDKQKIDRISNNFDIIYDANTETIRFRFR